MSRVREWRQGLVLAGVVLGSVALALGIIELAGELFLTPLLVRYSSNQALRVQLAMPKDLGIASRSCARAGRLCPMVAT